MLGLVKEFSNESNVIKCITHSGVFHADEVFSTILIARYYGLENNIEIMRTTVLPSDITADIVYDIGGGKFDHHQKGGNGSRENGIPYSSFGLVWKEYGLEFLNKRYPTLGDALVNKVYEIFDRDFVSAIDAHDNGYIFAPENIYTVQDIIKAFNPKWDDALKDDTDMYFYGAASIASTIFNNAIDQIISKVKAMSIVTDAINKSVGRIIILESYVPWIEVVLSSKDAEQVLYVVTPSARGGWQVLSVPDKPNSFGKRKALPKEWAGLKDVELQKVSGVKTAKFCHNALFICAADTFEDAFEMAKIAVNYEDLLE